MHEIAPDNLAGQPYPVKIDEIELKNRVDELSYAVLRKAATETAFTGEYTDTETIEFINAKHALPNCSDRIQNFIQDAAGPLYAPTKDDAVELIEDRSLFPRIRTEVRCSACGSHLGHVFTGEGYAVPTDQRWCINSVALVLEPKN